ncbi:MAG: hypothetical protein AMXMBFR12_08000 [Candidatus Babeliales bacterium]
MKNLVVLLVSVLFYTGCLLSMEKMPATIIFENNNHQTVEVSSELVQKIPALNAAYASHKLLSSIGTLGHVHLRSSEFQNFTFIQECINYSKQNLEDIKLALGSRASDISYLVKIADMAHRLQMNTVSKTMAHLIGEQFQSPKNRCEAVKNGQLEFLSAKPEVLNIIGQAILDPTGAKYYWLTQAKAKEGVKISDVEDQLHNYLSPKAAVLLLDSYENRVKGTPLAFAPGTEQIVFNGLREMLKQTVAQRVSYSWKQLNPVYKWTLAGLGATSLAAASYGFYSWYTPK